MAIDHGTETVTLTTTERTWRVDIQTALDVDPIIMGHREIVKMDGETVSSKTPAGLTMRYLSKVTDETVPGTTLTVGQMVEAFAALIDKWCSEDNVIESRKPRQEGFTSRKVPAPK